MDVVQDLADRQADLPGLVLVSKRFDFADEGHRHAVDIIIAPGDVELRVAQLLLGRSWLEIGLPQRVGQRLLGFLVRGGAPVDLVRVGLEYLALAFLAAWFGDPEIVSGFDLTAIVGTSIAANATVTVPWVQELMLYVLGATSNTVALTFVSPELPGPGGNYTTGNIVADHAVVFGPIPNIWANSSGLVTVNITGTVTGMTFGAYLDPNSSGPKHNPFEMAGAGAADY